MMIESDADILDYIVCSDETILLGYVWIIWIQETSSI